MGFLILFPFSLRMWIIILTILSAHFIQGCYKETSQKEPSPGSGKTSVVFIIIDTLRVDHLGTYGYHRNTSPNLDRFARQAIQFNNAYSAAPWTLPSVGSMLTGQYPSALNVSTKAVILDGKYKRLPEMFAKKGYNTGAVISHTYLSKDYGFDQGFAQFQDVQKRGKRHSFISSPMVAKEARQFIESNSNNPFFLLVHFFDPHFNYNMHKLLDFYPSYTGWLKSGISIERIRRKPESIKPDDKKYLRACYDSEIRYTDHYVSLVLRKLKKKKIFDKSLIIITADHGEDICSRADCWIGHTKKVTEELMHIPLLIKLPWQKRGRKIHRIFSAIDMMPTIAELVGLDIPDKDKISGKAFDLDNPGKGRRPAIGETRRWAKHTMVRLGKWKLVRDDEKKQSHLYKTSKGSLDKEDVAADHPKVVKRLEKIFFKWEKDVKKTKKDFSVTAKEPTLSIEQKKQLEAIGYIDPEDGGKKDER
ncbi:MAG: sulfatase [Proteobacteria bacterium]|nr:sulfatase [Pseudomonadota bacterium]